jgi:hypothetical protein
LVTSAVAIPLVLALHAADAPLAASAALCRVPIQRLPADGADDFFDGHLAQLLTPPDGGGTTTATPEAASGGQSGGSPNPGGAL